MSTSSNRRAIFRITGKALAEIFRDDGRERHYRVLKGLPVDAVVCGAKYDSTMDVWDVAVESESFAEVAEYEVPPTLPAVEFYTLEPARVEEPPQLLDGTGHLTEEGKKHFHQVGTAKSSKEGRDA